jgi:hypothetical protein
VENCLKRLATTVAAVLIASPAHAQSTVELFTPETVAVSGNIRIIGVDGETSWLDGGYGKTRFDTDSAGRKLRVETTSSRSTTRWAIRSATNCSAGSRRGSMRHWRKASSRGWAVTSSSS